MGTYLLLISLGAGASAPPSQAGADNGEFTLALPSHNGELRWRADGFTIDQSSAKPGGREIGIRGKDAEGRLTFLGFLFLFPEQAPVTSARCRDGVLEPEKRSTPTFRIETTSEITNSQGQTIALATYTVGGHFMVRAFVAAEDICGDLEFYSESPITADDPRLKKVLETYGLDRTYAPHVEDIVVYGEILYRNKMYADAAPIFEEALTQIPNGKSYATMRRVTVDQAGMAYGISGNITKARALFEQAIASDPDYPLYYYNLACADAEENKLDDARRHLAQAFARKGNVIAGETVPDPAKDDSFLPYRENKDFWQFIQSLH